MAVVVAAIALSTSASATPTQTIPASEGTFVVSAGSRPCANWGGYYVFHVGANASSVRRGLVSFDLSGIPATARILSATLNVYETITLRGSGTVGVHRVTTPWREGTGSNTCTGDGANWTATGASRNWATAGGDYAQADVASIAKTAGDQPGWDRFNVTSVAQGWVNHTYPNDGLLLKLDAESYSPCTTITNCNYWAYASDDYSDPAFRPTLTIVYR